MKYYFEIQFFFACMLTSALFSQVYMISLYIIRQICIVNIELDDFLEAYSRTLSRL